MKIAFMMRTIDQDNSFGVFTGNLLQDSAKDGSDEFLPASLQGAETFWPLREFCQRKGIAAAVEA